MEFEIVYIIYLVVSIYITIIVGNSLHKNGGVWIRHILNESIICDQINNLLLLAYRLLNIGYIIFTLMNTNTPYNMKSCFEFLKFFFENSLSAGGIFLVPIYGGLATTAS